MPRTPSARTRPRSQAAHARAATFLPMPSHASSTPASSTPTSALTPTPRGPWPTQPMHAAPAGASAPSTACRSLSRTSSASRAAAPRPDHACSKTGDRPTTRIWSSASAQRARCCSGRPTWTNSPWARPARTAPSAPRAIHGIRRAFRADHPPVRPRPWAHRSSRAPSALIPAGQFASQRHSAESPASSRPMAASRGTE